MKKQDRQTTQNPAAARAVCPGCGCAGEWTEDAKWFQPSSGGVQYAATHCARCDGEAELLHEKEMAQRAATAFADYLEQG